MNDTHTGVSFDGKANKDGHTWEIALYEITGAIKGINPNDGILGVEACELSVRNLISRVGFSLERSQAALHILVVILLKVARFDKRLGGLREISWQDRRYLVCDGFSAFFTLEVESRVESAKVVLKGALDAQVSLCNR